MSERGIIQQQQQPEPVSVRAFSFRRAATSMAKCAAGGTPIELLRVSGGFPTQEEVAEGRFPGDDAVAGFRHFVDVLGGQPPTQKSRCVVLELVFELVRWECLPADLLEHLFGTVLPAHPTLHSIDLKSDDVPEIYVRRLVESIPSAAAAAAAGSSSSLSWLGVRGQDRETAVAVADLVGRNVPSLSRLSYHPWRKSSRSVDHDDDGTVRIVCQSVPRNRYLRNLAIGYYDPCTIDSLDGAASSPSPLERLAVMASLSEACLVELGTQLRTNTAMVDLRLSDTTWDVPDVCRRFRTIDEALQTYNFTLVNVDLTSYSSAVCPGWAELEGRVRKAARRNRWIRDVLQILRPVNYHVSPSALLPRALERVADLPTLLYRLLRNGNVNALSRLPSSPLRHRGRRR